MEPSNLSSNWRNLRATLQNERPSSEQALQGHDPTKKRKCSRQNPNVSAVMVANSRKRITLSHPSSNFCPKVLTASVDNGNRHCYAFDLITEDLLSSPISSSDIPNLGISPPELLKQHLGKYLALDTESVGISHRPPNDVSVVARVSLVSYTGAQIYDSYVLPHPEGAKVTDYRTHVSGMTAELLRHGVARSFNEVQAEVARLLEGRLLVGHALRNDLDGLMLRHSATDVRDTARYRKYRAFTGGTTPSLKRLAKDVLGWEIQSGIHSSVVDARVSMALFRREKVGMDAEFGGRGREKEGKRNSVRALGHEGDDDVEKTKTRGTTNKAIIAESPNGSLEDVQDVDQRQDSGDDRNNVIARKKEVNMSIPKSLSRKKKRRRKKKGRYR